MGKVDLEIVFPLNLTMHLLEMCDQNLTSANSALCNGSISPIIIASSSSKLPVYEDVEELKQHLASQSLCDNGSFGSKTKDQESVNDERCVETEKETLYLSDNSYSSGKSANTSSDFSQLYEKLCQNAQNLRNEPAHNGLLTSHSEQKLMRSPSNPERHIGCNGAITSESKQKRSPSDPYRYNSDDSSFLSVDVGSSAQFSKVLENISLPLLYIPTTKQLVRAAPGDSDSGDPNKTEDRLQSPTSFTENRIQNGPKLSPSGPESPCSHEASFSSTKSEALATSALLSPPTSVLLTQGSSEFFHTSGNTRDHERLTKHSTDNFPTFPQQSELGVAGGFGDNSSLSSVSTDFSVSALSVGEEYSYSDSRSQSHATNDETLFMDINLHTRNSFDQGRKTASLDRDRHSSDNIPQATKKKALIGLK